MPAFTFPTKIWASRQLALRPLGLGRRNRSDTSDEAAMELLDVAPTMLAGARALLRYAYEVSERNDWIWPDTVVEGDNDAGKPWLALLCRHVADALDLAIAIRG
jgi:hypothetical protein